MNRKKANALMGDPYYSTLVHSIETLIHAHDDDAGSSYPDSLVKSTLRQTMARLKGTAKNKTPKNDKDAFRQSLSADLLENFQAMPEVPRKDYLAALLLTEESLKTRSEMHGGSRGYLDFLEGFLRDGTL